MQITVTIPELETERLILRAYDDARDLDRFAAFMETDASRFFMGPMDRYGTWRLGCAIMGHWMRYGYGLFAIEEKSSGEFAGLTGVWEAETWPHPELAWMLTQDKEGKGYATEAARRARDYIFNDLNWTSLVSAIEGENAGSMKVADRLGAKPDFEHTRPNGIKVIYYRHPAPEALQ
ncbi:MAG: GNAT family N-acetyltransferase [Pseudomonadota bacterium]